MLSVRKVKVSLPESMWWDVERLAKQTGQRVDQVIVAAVESYLGHESPPMTDVELVNDTIGQSHDMWEEADFIGGYEETP